MRVLISDRSEASFRFFSALSARESADIAKRSNSGSVSRRPSSFEKRFAGTSLAPRRLRIRLFCRLLALCLD